MPIKKILVTGSSGTIGTRLCEKLLEKGFAVAGIDKKPNQWSEAVNKLTIVGNLCDKSVFDNLPKDIDLVVNLAANARVYNLVVDPSLAFENFEILFNTMEWCRKNNIKRTMFASSREVYGNTERSVHKEDDIAIKNCESPYTASKMSGEALVHSYAKCYGMDFVITRFSNVYGMYDDSDRVVPLFIRLTKANQDIVIFGKEKMLDFTYIDDTVGGIISIIEKFDAVKNNTFNIATGSGVKIVDVARMIMENLGGGNKLIFQDNRIGEVVKYVADISLAKMMLGYEPKIGIEDGLKRSVEWYAR